MHKLLLHIVCVHSTPSSATPGLSMPSQCHFFFSRIRIWIPFQRSIQTCNREFSPQMSGVINEAGSEALRCVLCMRAGTHKHPRVAPSSDNPSVQSSCAEPPPSLTAGTSIHMPQLSQRARNSISTYYKYIWCCWVAYFGWSGWWWWWWGWRRGVVLGEREKENN